LKRRRAHLRPSAACDEHSGLIAGWSETCFSGDLTTRIHAGAGLKYVPDNHVGHIFAGQARKHGSGSLHSEINSRNVFERSHESADGGTPRGNNYDVHNNYQILPSNDH
jgi:hypothetical protein